MAVESDADRAIFVSADDFGVEITWTRAGGGSFGLAAIFDADHLLLTSEFLDEGQSGASPRVMVRSADIPPGAEQGDTLHIDGSTYRVVELRPDGTGMTDVKLHEA